jgi:hypothetical protein
MLTPREQLQAAIANLHKFQKTKARQGFLPGF